MISRQLYEKHVWKTNDFATRTWTFNWRRFTWTKVKHNTKRKALFLQQRPQSCELQNYLCGLCAVSTSDFGLTKPPPSKPPSPSSKVICCLLHMLFAQLLGCHEEYYLLHLNYFNHSFAFWRLEYCNNRRSGKYTQATQITDHMTRAFIKGTMPFVLYCAPSPSSKIICLLHVHVLCIAAWLS